MSAPLVTSTANARVKQIRALHRRKGRDQAGLAYVEGIRLVTAAAESGAPLGSPYDRDWHTQVQFGWTTKRAELKKEFADWR